MNPDVIFSIKPSTTAKNIRIMILLISTCESSGFDPQLPRLGTFTFEYMLGFTVEFSMLSNYLRLGRQYSKHTQFDTILKQRSACSNAYLASQETEKSGMIVVINSQSKSHITHCPTNYLWFDSWNMEC